MAAPTVEVRESGDVRILADRLADPTELLQEIGALLLSRASRSFRDQARGGEAWGERMVPNVPGIVADLNGGGDPKARRFDPRPALVDRGTLRNSLTMLVAGDTVVIGTNVPYAALHNEGGTSSVTLTRTGRARLTALLRRERRKVRGGRGDDRSAQLLGLGWLYSRPTFAVNVRKRTFLTITAEDVAEIRALVAEAVTRGRT